MKYLPTYIFFAKFADLLNTSAIFHSLAFCYLIEVWLEIFDILYNLFLTKIRWWKWKLYLVIVILNLRSCVLFCWGFRQKKE